jgi:hypothetical protein
MFKINKKIPRNEYKRASFNKKMVIEKKRRPLLVHNGNY